MEKSLRLENNHQAQVLFGKFDENIRTIESKLNVKIINRAGLLRIQGSNINVDKTILLIRRILNTIGQGHSVSKQDIVYELKNLKSNGTVMEKIDTSVKGKIIGPRTKGQTEYVEAIKKFDIVFGIGPAGTGKTYLAMAMAVSSLKKGNVRRIILTRPAIEAGENLGFLPGDMYEKITPYLRPLYDALYDMLEAERIEKYLEMGVIEVAALAYMRGRTLNDAFIILDEAQNCTSDQLKMFLTRLGFDSKTVITGDITQSDLPGGKPLGLIEAKKILGNIAGIKFINFTNEDVVRHELVQKIIEAYEKSK